MSHDTMETSYLGLYLTILANGPSQWTPEQVIQAYEYSKTLIPESMKAEVLEFSAVKGKFPLDKH
jgi:hypothetical protein